MTVMVMMSSSYDDSALVIWGWEYDHCCVLVIRMDDDYDDKWWCCISYLMSTCYSWPSEVFPPAFSMIYPMMLILIIMYDNDRDVDDV